MDLQLHFEPEPTVVSTVNNAGSTAYAGVFFPQATGFNIHGGVFTSNVTNNVYNPPPEQPSAFRTVLLGDINLIKEFKEMRSNRQSSVVGRQISRGTVRRVYKAKIEGRESGHMTVTMYEGDGAEQAWNQDRAKYEAIRHPNIMQLYGLAGSVSTSARACLEQASYLLWHGMPTYFRVENVSLDASDSEDPGFSVVKFLRNISLDQGFSYRILNLEPGYDSRRIRIPKLELRLSLWSDEVPMAWLAQANHIFAELQEREHTENYGASLTGSVEDAQYPPKAIYSFVLPGISALASDRVHIYANGQTVPCIGPSTHLVLIASARKTPECWDFLQFTLRL
ncbi:hypothetical protein MSAN_01505900 [Mycena sanguinolenta]|uniref:Protein kinase domain-containing protein n=1 Tax=Mycena sanguinolenta TaxID=230812 RepID=A0A8H6Y4M2_9AGAR|nr:hypothetical protein MSAN_01505900 [Mycena sanguinolenta]